MTAGGRDRTVRLWKIVEETQLVYRGDIGSLDSLKLVNEENFLTGGDSGSVVVVVVCYRGKLMVCFVVVGCG